MVPSPAAHSGVGALGPGRKVALERRRGRTCTPDTAGHRTAGAGRHLGLRHPSYRAAPGLGGPRPGAGAVRVWPRTVWLEAAGPVVSPLPGPPLCLEIYRGSWPPAWRPSLALLSHAWQALLWAPGPKLASRPGPVLPRTGTPATPCPPSPPLPVLDLRSSSHLVHTRCPHGDEDRQELSKAWEALPGLLPWPGPAVSAGRPEPPGTLNVALPRW